METGAHREVQEKTDRDKRRPTKIGTGRDRRGQIKTDRETGTALVSGRDLKSKFLFFKIPRCWVPPSIRKSCFIPSLFFSSPNLSDLSNSSQTPIPAFPTPLPLLFHSSSPPGEIHTDIIKKILLELFGDLTNDDIDDIIVDIVKDWSGWIDYYEFKELILGT
jgi:hypothetical protein